MIQSKGRIVFIEDVYPSPPRASAAGASLPVRPESLYAVQKRLRRVGENSVRRGSQCEPVIRPATKSPTRGVKMMVLLRAVAMTNPSTPSTGPNSGRLSAVNATGIAQDRRTRARRKAGNQRPASRAIMGNAEAVDRRFNARVRVAASPNIT